MASEQFHALPDAVDVRHLRYFAVVAEESSLRRAAERLNMAQPPLSRQIKQLEERLGVPLFQRHSKGLTLTAEGAKVLEIIRPLLAMRDATFARLRDEIRPGGGALRLGLTTAFEQGVFAALTTLLREAYGSRLRLRRASSPKLAGDVRAGRLDAALVALPLDAPGLAVRELAYAEPLVAAMPEAWPEAREASGEKRFPLERLSQKRLFWFKRETNPAFFDFAKARFAAAEFSPCFLEEPAEHDVLLARIAAGEGMGLFAASFGAIRRDGVVFSELTQGRELEVRLGLVTLPGKEDVASRLEGFFIKTPGTQIMPRL